MSKNLMDRDFSELEEENVITTQMRQKHGRDVKNKKERRLSHREKHVDPSKFN